MECVYFIRSIDSRLVKIGFTTDIVRRWKEHQAACGGRLNLRIHVSGSRADEEALHRQFAYAREHGEWFRPVPDLLRLIGRHRAHLTREKRHSYDVFKHTVLYAPGV